MTRTPDPTTIIPHAGGTRFHTTSPSPGNSAFVFDRDKFLFSCDPELAGAIVKLLNAALFPQYEVKYFTFTPPLWKTVELSTEFFDTAAGREEWRPVDEGKVGDFGILHCRIGNEFRACPPNTWRKIDAVLNVDRLLERGRNA